MSIKFPFLKSNNTIDIIAPSSGVPRDRVDDEIIKACKFISDLGFVPRVDKDIIVNGGDSFSANKIDYRAHHLIKALTSLDSDGVWCLRGGYGATNLIAELNKIQPPKKKKFFAGFSDITALHIYLNTKWNWPTLHSKVLYQLANKNQTSEKEVNDLKNLILGNINILSYNVIPLNQKAKTCSLIEGKVVGGNMSLIQASIGTDWQINSKNNILLFEEVDERGYQIDRMLYHFEQAKLFQDVKAVLIGDIICKKEKNGLELCDQAVSRFLSRVNIPVFRIKDIGHNYNNIPIPLGFINAKLKNNILEFELKK